MGFLPFTFSSDVYVLENSEKFFIYSNELSLSDRVLNFVEMSRDS